LSEGPQGDDLAWGLNSVAYLWDVTKASGELSAKEAIWVLVVGFTGSFGNRHYQLYACYSPAGGTGWQWETLGSPGGLNAGLCPNALLVTNEYMAEIRKFGHTFSLGPAFAQNVFVFTPGSDLNLYADFTPDASLGLSASWTWQALPPFVAGGGIFWGASTEIEASLASVQMFVFAEDIRGEGDIHTCRWDGSAWTWYDQQGP
jgi:hypothetical protein